MKFYDRLLFSCLLLGEQSTKPTHIFFYDLVIEKPCDDRMGREAGIA